MAAKGKLAEIVGSENVLDGRKVLEDHSKDLSLVPQVRPRCVVRPRNSEEVQKIVKWANETQTPLVPVSSGPPHFRGDTVPSVGGAVILDLSGMKEIARIDTKNRVAMVEPGVTFAELQPELEKSGMSAYMPLSPRRSKSVIGSMLEREPITMPSHHWDCTDPMLCAEIIFGTGDKLRSGEACGPDTLEQQWELGKAQMCPFGLSQFNENRLISGAQGTIGIITWATLKCRYSSKLNRTFLIACETIEPLVDLSYQLVRIRLGDNLFILNDLNLACLLAPTPKEIQKLRAILPPWILVISFEGYGELPEDKVAYQEADFKDMCQSCRLEPMAVLPGASAEDVRRLLSRPSEEPYWKLRLRGGCHDIFFLTTLDKTPGFITAMSTLAQSCRYPTEDIGTYIQMTVQGTSCHCEFNSYYDAARSIEPDGIKWLVTEGSAELARMGGFFSRPYGAWADFAYGHAAETVIMQKKTKEIFDPNWILNPGKMCF